MYTHIHIPFRDTSQEKRISFSKHAPRIQMFLFICICVNMCLYVCVYIGGVNVYLKGHC